MTYSIVPCALLTLISLWPTLVQAQMRQWSSSNGKSKVEAELVGFDGDFVKLKKLDGTEIKPRAASLSAADLKYLESRKKEFTPAEEPKVNLPIVVQRFREPAIGSTESYAGPPTQPTHVLHGHKHPVTAVAISPDFVAISPDFDLPKKSARPMIAQESLRRSSLLDLL